MQTSKRQELRIKLFSYDARLLDRAASYVVDLAARTGAKVVGPIPLLRVVKKFTLNRSTNIDKKSREQFEIRHHKRLVILVAPAPITIESLMKHELPSGVEAEIKLI